jgi:hypothetical protein
VVLLDVHDVDEWHLRQLEVTTPKSTGTRDLVAHARRPRRRCTAAR